MLQVGSDYNTEPRKEAFARGAFKYLNNEKKLSTPDFEQLQAGLILAGAQTVDIPEQYEHYTVAYENVVIHRNWTTNRGYVPYDDPILAQEIKHSSAYESWQESAQGDFWQMQTPLQEIPDSPDANVKVINLALEEEAVFATHAEAGSFVEESPADSTEFLISEELCLVY